MRISSHAKGMLQSLATYYIHGRDTVTIVIPLLRLLFHCYDLNT